MSVVPIEHIVDSLNETQRQAVTQIDGPLLMLAGPGSGKTRVITHRIAYMMAQGVPSQTILALTFTNKAAEEMKSRIEKLAPGSYAWAGTFHRFCSRLLRQSASMVGLQENFSIYDMGDSKKVAKLACEYARVELQHYSVDSIISQISELKSSGITHVDFQPRPGHALDKILARVYPEYQKQLQVANAVDFDDLLLHAVDLLRHNPELRQSLDMQYQYVMVDEYQDTNAAQYQLIRLLNHDVRNLGVTGDPDQSIYGWRGANIRNILDFEKDFPNARVIKLEQNYRSTKSILSVADQLIANNVQRKHKNLITENENGNPVRLVAYPSPREEANDIADSISLAINRQGYSAGDIAIFYRANWLSRSFEHALRQVGIPYQVVNGHQFYQRREIKDVLAYLQLINNPRDNVAFERIVNVPSRKIGKVTLGRIRDYAHGKGLCLLDAARQCGLIDSISKGAATKVAKFVALFDEISILATSDVETVIRTVVETTGYRNWLSLDETDEGHERVANVDELIVAAQEFDIEHPDDGGLERYLEQSALISDTDVWEGESDYVTLMTMHAAKGLEFPYVFVIGLEDGILPHERSAQDIEQVEEERRLLFVGITRAQKELQLSRCMVRFKRGSYWPAIASRFLVELPRSEMQIVEPRSSNMGGFGDDLPDDDDDIPFEVDPWSDNGIQINGDIDQRGAEDDEPAHADQRELFGDSNQDGADEVVQESPDDLPTLDINLNSKIANIPNLKTAAQIAEHVSPRIPPSMYRVGMRVEHDEYGIGTVTQLTGKDIKRTAEIDFPGMPNKRFRLSFCKLRMVD